MLRLETLNAKQGDCFLLLYGDATKLKIMLIDGGHTGVWKKTLKPRLEQLKKKYSPRAPLNIELAVVTHIDGDHIQGIIDMTKYLIKEKDKGRQPDFRIKKRWFNTFSALTHNVQPTALGNYKASAKTASASAFKQQTGLNKDWQTLIQCSVKQGDDLTRNYIELGMTSNYKANNKGLVVAGQSWTRYGLTMNLVGPGREQLTKLRKKWKKDTKIATLARYADRSAPNLSSIAMLMEYGGKKLLMTGDARGDHMLEELEEQGHLDDDGKLHVDVLKLPHHGSDRNVEPDFFNRITADTYIISADGSHDNPDNITLTWLVESRPKRADYELLFSTEMKNDELQTDLVDHLKSLKINRSFTYTFRDDDKLYIARDLLP